MQAMESQNFQLQLLKDELSRRVAKNSRYSLRSFAKSLGVSHTALSLAFAEKRKISRKAGLQIADRLGLEPSQAVKFINGAKSPRPLVGKFKKIELETFQLISDWIHYAILSLLECEGSKFEPRWISRRLGAGEMAVKVAMDRLVKLKMVEQVEGRWRQSAMPIKVDNKTSTAATRKFQRQLLEKALESLEKDPVEIRDFSSMTLSIDPKFLPFAKERIKQFRRELTAELEAKGAPKEVYNLTIQIYPVTQSINEGEGK